MPGAPFSTGLHHKRNIRSQQGWQVSHSCDFCIRSKRHIWDDMQAVSCMVWWPSRFAIALYAMQGLDVNDLRHRLNSSRSADPKPEQPQQRASLVSQVGQVSRSQPPQAPRVIRSELDFRPVSEGRSELDFRPVNDHRAELASRGGDRGSGRLVQIEEPPRRLKRQNSRRGG